MKKTAKDRGKRNGGFTLVELLVAGGMSAALLTVLTVSSGLFFDSYASGVDDQDLSLAHHLAMEHLVQAIAESSEAQTPSPESLGLTFPSGDTEEDSWSGTPGDSLYLSRNSGDPVVLADGVVDLEFSANRVDGFEETDEVENEEVLSFGGFSSGSREWDDACLETGDIFGFCFRVSREDRVNEIDLTEIRVRLGKLAGQTGDLEIVLREGYSEAYPRPWGPDIAVLTVPNGAIPPAAQAQGGGLDIDWMTVSLPAGFTIQANRFYCILFKAAGAAEAGWLRTDRIVCGTGPLNDMSYLGSTDGGSSWEPPVGGDEYRNRDVPVHLSGDVHKTLSTPITYVDSVDVTLGMALGNKEITKTRRAKIRGGGERR